MKPSAMALGIFVKEAEFRMKAYATRLLETAVLTVGPGQMESCRGKVLPVIDPTEHATSP